MDKVTTALSIGSLVGFVTLIAGVVGYYWQNLLVNGSTNQFLTELMVSCPYQTSQQSASCFIFDYYGELTFVGLFLFLLSFTALTAWLSA